MLSNLRGVLGLQIEIIFLRVVGAGLLIGVQAWIAREFGAAITGKYYTIYSLMVMWSIVSRQGLETWGYQKLSMLDVSNSEVIGQIVSKVLYRVFINSLLFAGATALLVHFLSPIQQYLEVVFTQPLLFIFSVVSFSTLMSIAEILKGVKQVRISMILSGIVYPTVLLILFPITISSNIMDILGAHVIAMVCSALLAVTLMIRTLGLSRGSLKILSPPTTNETRAFWLNSIVHRAIVPWSPIVLLGFFTSDIIVGWFSTAMRIAVLASFFSIAVVSGMFPKFVNVERENWSHQLTKAVKSLNFLLAPLVIIPMFIVALAPKVILSVFGSEFLAASDILPWLTLGQCVFSFSLVLQYCFIFSKDNKILQETALFLGVTSVMFITPGACMRSPMMVSIGILLSQLFYFLSLYFFYNRRVLSQEIL